MSDSPQPPRSGTGFRSIGEMLGHLHQTTKRPVLFKQTYTAPALSFHARMQWLAKVQRLIATCRQNHEHYPRTVHQIAYVIAHIGGECRLSYEGIAERAGCVVRTVSACINWLEEHGVLTWSHTARRDKSRRIVRSHNLYSLILDFTGFRAFVARARRALWRDREKEVSKGKVCPGVTQQVTSQQYIDAQKALADARRIFEKRQAETWANRHTVLKPV